MKAELKDGFKIDIIDEVADDWEFLEVLSDIDEGETGQIVKAAKMLLGKEGVKALKEHIRDKDGTVKTTAMVDALGEILNSVSDLKNS